MHQRAGHISVLLGLTAAGFDGWSRNRGVVWRQGPAVRGVALELPCRFGSPDGLSSDFTNFVSGYEALLDYCWYERDRLAAQAFVPLPGRKEVRPPSPATPPLRHSSRR